MAVYATRDDMISRFGESELIALTDRDDTGAINVTVLDQALADANTLIDGYLGGRYDLPLADAPAMLTPLACDLARYRLYDEQPTDLVSEREKTAIRTLEKIASGAIRLQVASGEPAPTTDEPKVMFDHIESDFRRSDMEGW